MDLNWIPEAKQAYDGSKRKWKELYDAVLDKIIDAPGYGDHMYLEKRLHCNHRVHVSDHRIVYRIFSSMDMVVVMGIGHKPDAYDMARNAFAKVWGLLTGWRRPKR